MNRREVHLLGYLELPVRVMDIDLALLAVFEDPQALDFVLRI